MVNHDPNDIWSQMGYVPPRGPCNHKPTIMSATCTCLRFMVHPLKASSSYSCDGCSHHASFHQMENKAEDEIIRRWQAEEQLQKDLIESTAPPRKRRRGDRSDIESVDSETTNMLTNGTSAGAQRPMLEWTDENGGSWKDTNQNGSSTVPKVAKQKLRAPATRGRGGHRK